MKIRRNHWGIRSFEFNEQTNRERFVFGWILKWALDIFKQSRALNSKDIFSIKIFHFTEALLYDNDNEAGNNIFDELVYAMLFFLNKIYEIIFSIKKYVKNSILNKFRSINSMWHIYTGISNCDRISNIISPFSF